MGNPQNEKESLTVKYTGNIIFPACTKVDGIKKRKHLYTQMSYFVTNAWEKYEAKLYNMKSEQSS